MSAARIVLGSRAAAMRRQIGPSPWVVLEALHDVATDVDGACVARTATRRLSEQLGIGKDAISRALRTLRANGLVTLNEQRRDTGRFSSGTYRLHTPSDVLATRTIRAQINSTSVIKPQAGPTSRLLSDGVAIATSSAPSPTPVCPGPVRGPHLAEPVTSLQLDLFATIDAATNVGSNQRSKGGSRTCISDARNVAARSSRLVAPGPVAPHPEKTDTGSSPC